MMLLLTGAKAETLRGSGDAAGDHADQDVIFPRAFQLERLDLRGPPVV
jgi:hypothetical protein